MNPWEKVPKDGELVFYISNQKLAVGTILRKIDVDKWLIKPTEPNKELVKRKKEYIFPVRNYKKYLTFSK